MPKNESTGGISAVRNPPVWTIFSTATRVFFKTDKSGRPSWNYTCG